MKIAVAFCISLVLLGCTSLVPTGSNTRNRLGYDQAFEKAEAYIKKHDLKTASLMRTTEDDDAYYFLYSLEHENVAYPFRRTVRVKKDGGRVKVVNDYR